MAFLTIAGTWLQGLIIRQQGDPNSPTNKAEDLLAQIEEDADEVKDIIANAARDAVLLETTAVSSLRMATEAFSIAAQNLDLAFLGGLAVGTTILSIRARAAE